MTVLTGVAAVIGVAAVAAWAGVKYIFPRKYPVDAPAGRTPGHFIFSQAPKLLVSRRILGVSFTRWDGPGGKFTSISLCPFGYPQPDKPKRCLQVYWGVKADGSESRMLQQKDSSLWDWVYTKKEQSALRITRVGYSDPYNMAGS